MINQKVIRRVTKASRTMKMTLPKEFLTRLGINLNEMVNVELINDKIVITKKKLEEE